MPQEMTDKMSQSLKGGLVRPKDPVTVYATEKNPFYKLGEGFEVHSALADKLIASGKATKDAPADKAKK